MKREKLVIWLVLATTLGACWGALAEAGPGHFASDEGLLMAAAPERGSDDLAPPFGPPMEEFREAGPMGRDPRLAGLVRDIIALRQINRADLSPQQIEKVLPALQKLAREEGLLIKQTKEALLDERARLLRQSGPAEMRPGLPMMRGQMDSYQQKVEATRAELGRILSAPQAEILGRMIGPPGPFGARFGGPVEGPRQGTTGRRAGGAQRESGRGAAWSGGPAGRGAEAGRGPKGLGRARAIEVSRLVELLEEKLAAMRKAK